MASWSSQRSAHSPRSAIAAAPTHPLRVHRLPWAHAFHPKQRTQHELGLHESRESWDNSGGGGPHADRRNAFWVSYLKRRRRMHTAAHELYIWLTNVIMLPALLLSALASVLSVMLKEEQLGPYIITGITATSTFLIGVQQHLKVESKAESHRISAHRFDQLVTEAVSRSIITGITVRDVAEWEKELHRIAEVNQFVMPSSIRRRYAGTAGHDEPRRRTLARKRRRLASVFPWYHQTPQPSESIGTDVLPAHQQPTPQQAPLPLPAAAPEQRQYQHQRARSASDDAETSPAAPPRPPFLLSLPPVARPPAMIAPSRPCIPTRAPPQPSSCQQGR